MDPREVHTYGKGTEVSPEVITVTIADAEPPIIGATPSTVSVPPSDATITIVTKNPQGTTPISGTHVSVTPVSLAPLGVTPVAGTSISVTPVSGLASRPKRTIRAVPASVLLAGGRSRAPRTFLRLVKKEPQPDVTSSPASAAGVVTSSSPVTTAALSVTSPPAIVTKSPDNTASSAETSSPAIITPVVTSSSIVTPSPVVKPSPAKAKPASKVLTPSHFNIAPMMNKLKKYNNKCVLCHVSDEKNLKMVAFVEDRDSLRSMYRKYGSVVLCEDDMVCPACVNIAMTISQNISALRQVCKDAVSRQRITQHSKVVYNQENFAESLSKNLVRMFEQARHCGTSLVSNDLKEFKIHGAVLAASTSRLDQELEKGSNIGLKDITEEGLRTLVKYLYTGELVVSVSLARQILPYCEKWGLDWAAQQCKALIAQGPSRGRPRGSGAGKKKSTPTKPPAQPAKVTIKQEVPAPGEDDPISDTEGDGYIALAPDTPDPVHPSPGDPEPGEVDFRGKVTPRGRTRVKEEVEEYEDGKLVRTYTRKSVVCDHCNKTYRRLSSLKEHVLRVHDQLRPYMCEHCAHSAATKKDLQMHLRIKHHDKIDQTEKKKYTCPECGLTRGSLTQLKIHMARKHSDERNCVCEHCGMGFKTTGNLREHTRYMHDPGMQLQCTYEGCDRVFRGRFKLKEHMRRCHEQGEKRHKCQMCSYKTHYSHSLRQHYSVKHNMRMSYLTKEWQAPNLKKRVFEENKDDLGDLPPYTLEPIPQGQAPPGGTTLHHDSTTSTTSIVAVEPTLMEHKYFQTVLQNTDVNRILYEQTAQGEQAQVVEARVADTINWDGQQYMQLIGDNLHVTELPADSNVEDVEMVTLSDKREQEAAVALITVGGAAADTPHTTQAETAHTQLESEYTVHMDNDNVYIVLPPEAAKPVQQ